MKTLIHIHPMKLKCSLVLITRCLIAALALFASRSGIAQVIYSGGTYLQNFDTLPNSPNNTTFIWSDNSTLAGWYSQTLGSTTGISSGSAVSGARLYSWGSFAATDRALGTLGQNNDPIFGLQLQNNTGGMLTSFTLTFTGEQWRRNTDAATLDFGYFLTSASTNQIGNPAFIDVNQLDFTSLHTGAGGGLDGNLPVNQTANITHTVSGIEWNSGEYLWVRWADLTNSTAAAGLGVDNLSFTAVPEPGTLALTGLALVCAFLVRRKHTRRGL